MACNETKCNECNEARTTLIEALIEEAEAIDYGFKDRYVVSSKLNAIITKLYGKEAIVEARKIYHDRKVQ